MPDENLSNFGNGANRTLIVHRKDGVVGDTTVSVMVDDGEHSAVTAFHLTVVPKAPPPKTAAFWDIVGAGSAPEDAELADVIEAMGNPDVLTLGQLIDCALQKQSEAADWLIERKNRRAIPHRMERCGYVSVRNPDAKSDGRWVFQHRKQVVYANAKLSVHEQIAADQLHVLLLL